MTQDEIVELGNFVEDVRTNRLFSVLVTQFEEQVVQHMLVTEPHEAKKREGIYASFLGVRDFLGNMNAIVDERNKILKANEAPSEEDAHGDID